jgi:hypothetical protein
MRRAILPALLLVLVSVVLGATVFREQVAQAMTILQVHVTNATPSDAVAVHEQGAVSVQQAGGPQSVRLVGADGVAGYTVPDGKRLVIEYVNGTSSAGDGHLQLGIEAAGGGSQAIYNFQSSAPPGSFIFPISEQVLIFAGPGETVRLINQNDDVRINGYLLSA